MHLYLPNSAHLQNIEHVLRRIDTADDDAFQLTLHRSYVSVHPMVLSMAAAAGVDVVGRGGTLEVQTDGTSVRSLRYLQRMRLFDLLGLRPVVDLTEGESAGRFIPLSQITDGAAISDFIVEMVPLLHTDPRQADAIKYVISELLRNVLEHAASPVGAMICAQYYPTSQRISLGVADSGVGIRASLGRSHPSTDALDAIQLALRPGVTGTTNRIGGTEENAGVGLFVTKSVAQASRNHFVVVSDDAMFKLLRARPSEPRPLFADAHSDRATRRSGLPGWRGTAIGIDLSVRADSDFQALLREILRISDADERRRKKERYKKPRFR